MKILTWLWNWVFGTPLHALEREAARYGMITLQQTHFEYGTGWTCSIRPEKGIRYSWSATGPTVPIALGATLEEARQNPISAIVGTPCVPRLGGREFDPDA